MALILVGSQYVDPDRVVAVLQPTSAHVSLVDGVDLTLRSVVVLIDGTLVPTSAPPRLAVRQLSGEDDEPKDRREHPAAAPSVDKPRASDKQPAPTGR